MCREELMFLSLTFDISIELLIGPEKEFSMGFYRGWGSLCYRADCRQPISTDDSWYFSISLLSTGLVGCRQESSSTTKYLTVAHWIIDSPIGLSTALVNRLAQNSKKEFYLFKLFCLIPKQVYFTLLEVYQCFNDWMNRLAQNSNKTEFYLFKLFWLCPWLYAVPLA